MFGSVKFEYLSLLSRRLIRIRMTMTALAIKAGLLVHWCTVLFTCVKGLSLWLNLHGLVPILMLKGWSSVGYINGAVRHLPACLGSATWHPIWGL